jgi:hypothetical protein
MEVAQEPLDVVSLNDESLELELSTTTRALQHVNLERAFHEFGPWAIVALMRRGLRRVGVLACQWRPVERRRNHQRTKFAPSTEHTRVMHEVKSRRGNRRRQATAA